MFIIGIDVGNYDTKTQNTSTPTGYEGPFSEKPPKRRFFCVISSIFEVCLTTSQLWSER